MNGEDFLSHALRKQSETTEQQISLYIPEVSVQTRAH